MSEPSDSDDLVRARPPRSEQEEPETSEASHSVSDFAPEGGTRLNAGDAGDSTPIELPAPVAGVAEAFTVAAELEGRSRRDYLAKLAIAYPNTHSEVISLLGYDRSGDTLIAFERPKKRDSAVSFRVRKAGERLTETFRPGETASSGSRPTVAGHHPDDRADSAADPDGSSHQPIQRDRETVSENPASDASSSAATGQIPSDDPSVIGFEDLRGIGDDLVRRGRPTLVGGSPTLPDIGHRPQPQGALQTVARAGLRTVRGRMVLFAGLVSLALLLGGWSLERRLANELKQQSGETLNVIVEKQVDAITAWVDGRSRDVQVYARDPDVRRAITELVEASREVLPSELPEIPEQERLRQALEQATGHRTEPVDADGGNDGLRYAVWRPDRMQVGDWILDPADYGRVESAIGAAPLQRVFGDETVVYIPQRGGYVQRELPRPPEICFTTPVYANDLRTGRPTIVAALLVGGIFQDEFGDIVSNGRFGPTGETYVINGDGQLLSTSRFAEQMAVLGWPQVGDAGRTVGIRITDPGRDLTAATGSVDREELEDERPTAMVDRLIGADEPIQLLEPYRDYRGVPVVGAGRWLPEIGLGLIAEVDQSQAFAPVALVSQTAMLGLFGLALTSLAAIALAYYSYRLERSLAEQRRMGPYILKDVLGEGGMGTVWRAEHDLLRRPTAVKVLKAKLADELSAARFEREVKLASRLQSPHTIDIYDYGRTDNDRFYCAMALLDGLTLRQLVARYGIISPSRTVHLVSQVAKSLSEAHRMGLVHRDIKPANVMVCDRGGEADWVMVLDFGLAKEVRPPQGAKITNTTMLIGTPDFIAPERIRDPSCVDPRSDLYAVGVMTYFLVTGQPCFETTGQLDALEKALYADPPAPSTINPTIPASLDALILDLVAKDPDARIGSAEELLTRLSELPIIPWTYADARQWWDSRNLTAEVQHGS